MSDVGKKNSKQSLDPNYPDSLARPRSFFFNCSMYGKGADLEQLICVPPRDMDSHTELLLDGYSLCVEECWLQPGSKRSELWVLKVLVILPIAWNVNEIESYDVIGDLADVDLPAIKNMVSDRHGLTDNQVVINVTLKEVVSGRDWYDNTDFVCLIDGFKRKREDET